MENPNRTQTLLKNLDKLSIQNNKLKKENEKLKKLLKGTIDDYYKAKDCATGRYISPIYCFPDLNSEVYKYTDRIYHRRSQLDYPRTLVLKYLNNEY